jgi:hypothetical protein
VVDGQSLMIQPYIGLERLAEAEGSGADVFKNATIALSRAKSERREHWQYFTRDMQVATQQRLSLLHDLRHAAEAKRGLSLHYQPQVDIASGRVIGARPPSAPGRGRRSCRRCARCRSTGAPCLPRRRPWPFRPGSAGGAWSRPGGRPATCSRRC